jgi:TetR/AcrR family transcriptional regulator, mexJK operon transcriptional repressor
MTAPGKRDHGMANRPRGRAKGRPKDPVKRHGILSAARDLFLEHGLTAVSMDAIADRAGVSKATVYSHFGDKDDLLRAVLEAETGDYEPPPEQISLVDEKELRHRLTAFGTALLSVLTRPGVLALGRLVVNEAHRHPDEAAHFFARGPAATHRRLTALLDAATKRGFLSCDDTGLMADHLLSMWIGQRHLRQQLGLCRPPRPREIAEHVEACIDTILRACRP